MRSGALIDHVQADEVMLMNSIIYIVGLLAIIIVVLNVIA